MNPNTTHSESSLLRSSEASEKAIQASISQAHSSAGQQMAALEAKQRNWFTKFFTERGLVQVLQNQKIQNVKDFGEAQRNLFRLATDTKLDMAHSMCLAMSRELKVGNQERFTSMVLQRHENLRKTVQAKREGFLADMDAAYTNAEAYAHRPWLADRAIASLQVEVEQYFTWIDSLLEDFMAISKQRLDEYRKDDLAPKPSLGSTWL